MAHKFLETVGFMVLGDDGHPLGIGADGIFWRVTRTFPATVFWGRQSARRAIERTRLYAEKHRHPWNVDKFWIVRVRRDV